MGKVVKIKEIFVYSLFSLRMKTNSLVIIMRTLWMPYRSESEVLLRVMLCISVCVCVSRRHGVWEPQGACTGFTLFVWWRVCGYMLRDSEIISALPRKPLVRQQLSQHNPCLLSLFFFSAFFLVLSSLCSSPLYCPHFKCLDNIHHDTWIDSVILNAQCNTIFPEILKKWK